MVLDIDWAMVSAWAAMVTATGAIVAVWLQNRHARITRSLDVLLRLEGKFDSDRMKDLRRKAATGFLAGKFVDEAYYVLDFFEEAGLLLRMKAIHEEILFESFYHSPPAYWYTAKKYILEMRRTRKELYDNLEYLAERDLDYARKKTGGSTDKMEAEAYWKDFIVRETQAS
ncbi:MAG: hypothetical protein ABSB53_04745 [Nitrososphaerales archaeon]